jgi:uncharacterized protein
LQVNYKPAAMSKFLTLLLLLFFTATALGQADNKPFVLGEVHELPSKVLNEKRTLNIYLPDGYKPNDTTQYDVIYLLDGSADEDFIHIAGMVQFYSFEWIALLRPTIVVGIATVDRRRDFTFPTAIAEDKKAYPTTGGSANFIQFIEKELQPYIEKKYNTTRSKTIIGQSLGGLLATEILFKKPTLFTTYIIVSPSLWWSNGALLNDSPATAAKSFTQPTKVYIGVGKEGLTPTAQPRVMEVDANVLAEKIKQSNTKNVTVLFDYLPQENHATILHQAVMNAFQLLQAPKHAH